MTGGVISGIIFVIRNGLRWRDAPKDYGGAGGSFQKAQRQIPQARRTQVRQGVMFWLTLKRLSGS